MPNSVTEYIADTAIKNYGNHGPRCGGRLVADMVAKNTFSPHQLDLRVLAERCFGRDFKPRMSRWAKNAEWVADATETSADLSAFKAILNQVTATVEADPTTELPSVADQLVRTVTIPKGTPDAPVQVWRPALYTDPARDVLPGTPYPRTGFRGWYYTRPQIDKFGLIAYLTLEMVEANDVVGFLDANAEVRRAVSDLETTRKLRLVYGLTNNYSRNGTTFNTYLTSGDRVNKITDLNLADGPAELDRIDTLFRSIRHPITGRKVNRAATRIVTAAASPYSLRAALGVTVIERTDGDVTTTTDNPFQFGGQVVSDPLAEDLLVAEGGLTPAQARTVLIYGNPQAAFTWQQIESLAQFEVGPTEEGWGPPFEQDVVYATKTRSRGAGYVNDPTEVVFAYDASA